MNIKKKLSGVLIIFVLIFSLGPVYGQNCKRAFYSAKEQYNGGQFRSTQNLLNACIDDFNVNKASYLDNQDQVFKVYKLYIASCTESNNRPLANAKRQELIKFFSESLSEEEVIDRLNKTPL